MTTTTKPRPRDPEVYVLSEFCKQATDAKTADGTPYHQHCPGSVVNGADSIAYCTCQCHVEVPVCRDCRQHGVELTLTGTCIDVEGCDEFVMTKRSANPVFRMLEQIAHEAEAREAALAAERAEARRVARERDAAERAARGDAPLPPRAPRTPKAPPTPQQCHCGCGGMTKGGKFVAGHDAKLKGRLVKAARQTPPDDGSAPATQKQAVNSMAELIARDWPRKNVDAKIIRQADALVEQHGPDFIIEAYVKARYGSKR